MRTIIIMTTRMQTHKKTDLKGSICRWIEHWKWHILQHHHFLEFEGRLQQTPSIIWTYPSDTTNLGIRFAGSAIAVTLKAHKSQEAQCYPAPLQQINRHQMVCYKLDQQRTAQFVFLHTQESAPEKPYSHPLGDNSTDSPRKIFSWPIYSKGQG